MNTFICMNIFSSYLYIARSRDPAIIRYDPDDGSVKVFSSDGSAQSISIDEYNNVIYWVNYDGIRDTYMVMRTLLNNKTVELNITYTGEIKVTSDVLNLYVLNTDNNVIDKYLKTSLEREGNITYTVAIHDLVIAYGKSQVSPLVN